MNTQPDQPARAEPSVVWSLLSLLIRGWLFLSFAFAMPFVLSHPFMTAMREGGDLAALGRDPSLSKIAGLSFLAGVVVNIPLMYLLLIQFRRVAGSLRAMRRPSPDAPSKAWGIAFLIVLVLLVASAATFITTLTIGSAGPPYALTCTLQAERDVFAVGEPVVIELTVTNQLDRSLRVHATGTPLGDERGYWLEVRRNGMTVWRPDSRDEEIPRTGGEWSELAAGEQRTARINVSQWFYLTEPGEYELLYRSMTHCQFFASDDSYDGRQTSLRSNVVTIHVEAAEE